MSPTRTSWRSAKGFAAPVEPDDPTAMQDVAAVQDTPPSWPFVAPAGIGTVVMRHVPLVLISARGVVWNAVATRWPTATHVVLVGHDTARNAPCAAKGVAGCSFQTDAAGGAAPAAVPPTSPNVAMTVMDASEVRSRAHRPPIGLAHPLPGQRATPLSPALAPGIRPLRPGPVKQGPVPSQPSALSCEWCDVPWWAP